MISPRKRLKEKCVPQRFTDGNTIQKKQECSNEKFTDGNTTNRAECAGENN